MDPKLITRTVVGTDVEKKETITEDIITKKSYPTILKEIAAQEEAKAQDIARHDGILAELADDLQFAKDNNLD